MNLFKIRLYSHALIYCLIASASLKFCSRMQYWNHVVWMSCKYGDSKKRNHEEVERKKEINRFKGLIICKLLAFLLRPPFLHIIFSKRGYFPHPLGICPFPQVLLLTPPPQPPPASKESLSSLPCCWLILQTRIGKIATWPQVSPGIVIAPNAAKCATLHSTTL